MDQDPPPPSRPKRRFAPRAPPPSRRPNPPVQKTEVDDEEETARAQNLLQNFVDGVGRRKSKAEKKSAVQVALQAPTSSTTIRSYGVSKDENVGKSSNSDKALSSIPSSVAKEDGEDTHLSDADEALAPKPEKKYREPWDYKHSYYPTVLPLREPFSGDPELLDEEEFGEATRNLEYDESTMNSAKDLGLTLEERYKQKMFLFKLPSKFPIVKQPTSTKSKEKVGSSISVGGSKKDSSFEELSEGHMGKMLVYKSGAIKLKLGEVLYDVSPGLKCVFPEDAVVINTEERHCCVLGSLGKHVVVTPDVDSLINSVEDM